MYNADFWRRVNIQRICGFIKTGGEECEVEKGTPEERHRRHAKAYEEGLKTFRDRIIAFDWKSCQDEDQEGWAMERMWAEAMLAHGNLESLAFEMGFCAGMVFAMPIGTMPTTDRATGR